MKFLLYDINPGEQFFKQFAGFMYFLQLSKKHNYTLVLSPFRVRKPNFGLKKGYRFWELVSVKEKDFNYFSWEKFYDINKLKEKYNVILLEDYLKNNNNKVDVLLNRITNWEVTNEKGKTLFCGEEINFGDIEVLINNDNILPLIEKNLKKHDSLAVYGTTFQLPITEDGYSEIRKNIKYLNIFYNEIESFLDIFNKKYLAVHWRREDFIYVKRGNPGILLTPPDLVKKCKEKMSLLGLEKVYISTDSTNLDELSYIKNKLPLIDFKITNKNLTNNECYYSIIESLICSYADYFMGTKTSWYSENILAERLELGKESDTQEYL